MATRRGSTVFWNGEAVADNEESKGISVGSKPYVTIYIFNDASGAKTFDVQVSAGGRLNDADPTDTKWFSYDEIGTAGLISVAGDTAKAFDLSPFGPGLIRLVAREASNANEIYASASALG